jgi:metacaspase-1
MNKALLVGINNYPIFALNGCVNDVGDMARFLVSSCGFKQSEIRLLADEQASTGAILAGLQWLISAAKPRDRLYFYYSGHGLLWLVRNANGDAWALEDIICPVDFDFTNEHLISATRFRSIFETVPEGVEFVWVADCCFSGGLVPPTESATAEVLRLFPVHPDMQWLMDMAMKAKKFKRWTLDTSVEGLCVGFLAACKSHQISGEIPINGRYNGCFTYFLLKELSGPGGLSTPLASLIQEVQKELAQNRYSQEPQIGGDGAITSRAFLADPGPEV